MVMELLLPQNDEPVSEYNASTIVHRFHKVPHYDLRFHAVNHTFAPTERAYQEAIVQLIWPMVVAALLFCLWRLIRHLCCSKGKDSSDLKEAPNLTCSRISYFVLLIISVVAIGISFYGNAEINKSVSQLETHANNAHDLVHTAIVFVLLTANNSQALSTELMRVNWTQYPAEVQTDATTLNTALLGTANTLVNLAQSASEYDPADINEEVEKYNKIRDEATLGFTAFILFLCLLAGISVCLKKNFFMLVCAFLVGVAFFLSWTLGGVEFGLGVALADFCTAPGEYIISEVQNAEVVFFVDCPNQPSPFEPQFDTARSYVASGDTLIKQISNQTGDAFPQIEAGISALNTTINALSAQFVCNGVHNELIGGVSSLCTTGFDGMMAVLFSHTTCGFLLIFIALLLSSLIRHTDPDRGYYSRRTLLYSERSPLFDDRGSYYD